MNFSPKNELSVRDLHIRNRVFLAPMSGITDVPFRRLAWRFGAGAVVSEMVASEALSDGEAEMALRMQGTGTGLHIVQLAGREKKWMRLAAKIAVANGADIIDINMGCPAKRVTTGYSGSALMRDLDHALGLIDSVIDAVDVPVTLKMRLGWDEHSINAPELAERAQYAGVRLITVHGRTRCQFYEGQANWHAVREVCARISVPLIVNGDIADSGSAKDAMRASGADGVMIGRAACGAPWLPGTIAGASTAQFDFEDPAIVGAVATEHYDAMLTFYGTAAGNRRSRKHLSAYLDRMGVSPADQQRRRILTADEPQVVFAGLAEWANRQEASVLAA